jgi:hypothetical protein
MASDTTSLIERSGRLEISGIDFDAFRAQPLDSDALRCLRYMHDIEGHTMCYLRDVIVTRVHKDPELSAFLACWAYEEHWHGDAIARVLAAHGEAAGRERLEVLRRRLPRREGLRPLLFSLGSAVTAHLPAVHMAWGAVNEWSTQAGYGRLAVKTEHPVLGELLRRIMRQEGRHIDFYASEARRRLAAHPRARSLARLALRRFWSPVGAGVMPEPEVSFVTRYLFGDAAGFGAALRIDRQVDRLPGLEGLHLVEHAVQARRLAA